MRHPGAGLALGGGGVPRMKGGFGVWPSNDGGVAYLGWGGA